MIEIISLILLGFWPYGRDADVTGANPKIVELGLAEDGFTQNVQFELKGEPEMEFQFRECSDESVCPSGYWIKIFDEEFQIGKFSDGTMKSATASTHAQVDSKNFKSYIIRLKFTHLIKYINEEIFVQ